MDSFKKLSFYIGYIQSSSWTSSSWLSIVNLFPSHKLLMFVPKCNTQLPFPPALCIFFPKPTILLFGFTISFQGSFALPLSVLPCTSRFQVLFTCSSSSLLSTSPTHLTPLLFSASITVYFRENIYMSSFVVFVSASFTLHIFTPSFFLNCLCIPSFCTIDNHSSDTSLVHLAFHFQCEPSTIRNRSEFVEFHPSIHTFIFKQLQSRTHQYCWSYRQGSRTNPSSEYPCKLFLAPQPLPLHYHC